MLFIYFSETIIGIYVVSPLNYISIYSKIKTLLHLKVIVRITISNENATLEMYNY